MIDPHLFAVFMAGAIALNLTPGPDMTFVLAQATHRGARAGIAASLGIGVGTLFHMTLTAFGLAALFALWPLAFVLVRYAGAVYLLWIAWKMIRGPAAPVEGLSPRDATAAAFRQGVITNVLNPKVAMFFAAFLPQFVQPAAGPTWAQILILGLAFDISGTLVNCLVALGGGRAAARLKVLPQLRRAMEWLSASVMLGLALRLAWPERR